MLLESEQDKKDRQGGRDYDKLIEHFTENTPQPIYLVIDKNRYNAPTAIKLEFNGQYSTFTEGQVEQYPF